MLRLLSFDAFESSQVALVYHQNVISDFYSEEEKKSAPDKRCMVGHAH